MTPSNEADAHRDTIGLLDAVGLVVEAVTTDSAGEQAGLQVEDRLLSYDGKPLSSPAALQALEENTFGQEQVALQVRRGEQVLSLLVPLGPLGIEARPELSADVLALYEEGRAAQQADRTEEAVARWMAAAQAAQAAGDRGTAAWLYGRVGEGYEKGSHWQQAQEAYAAAWELLQASADAAAQSRLLLALGRCCENRSDFAAAAQWYEQAQQIDVTAGHEMWVARDINHLGTVAYLRGELSGAQDYHTRALTIREHLSPHSLDVAASLANLGLVAQERGDLASAQDYLTRALAIYERLAPNSLLVAASLNNLGNVAYDRGDLSGALDYHRRALAIRERLAPHSLGVAYSLNGLGIVARQRGDLSGALDYHRRALAIRERLAPHSLDVAASLCNLGVVAHDRGDLSGAHDYFTRALAIGERLAPNSLHVAASLNNLGLVAKGRGDLASAQDYHTRALAIKERLAPHSLDVAMSLGNLGSVAQERGELSEAQDYFAHALAIFERLAPHSLDMAESLDYLARIALQESRLQAALSLFVRAVQIVEAQRSQIAATEARALLVAKHTSKYLGLLRTYLALDDLPHAFATLERARARSLVELLAQRPLDLAAEAPAHLLQQQQALDRERSQAYTALARLDAVADEAQITTLQSHLLALERQQQTLTATIQQTSPHYASLQYPAPLDLAGAQAALDPGTLLLSYQVDEQATYLFAVTQTSLHLFTLPVGKQALEQQVRAFRQGLDVRFLDNTIQSSAAQGQALYDLLLAPAQSQIQRAKRLLLCPDGPLHTLPFAALVSERRPRSKPRYLGQDKPLHAIVSLTVYAQNRQQTRDRPSHRNGDRPNGNNATSKHNPRLLALGDPLYLRQASPLNNAATGQAGWASVGTRAADGEPTATDQMHTPQDRQDREDKEDRELSTLRDRGLTLTPLPGSRHEVEAIARLFAPHATLRLREQATKTAATTQSQDADIVHFACHGWLDNSLPLSSGLLLSQPEALGADAPPDDNGLLQAWEIFERLRLQADLVVLSACQTGLGQEVRGEGLIGLTRAFSYAGARSVLVSLWKIEDASTAAFMQAFYTSLRQGTSKDVALQQAMGTLARDPKWQHPFYWCPFLLVGDWS